MQKSTLIFLAFAMMIVGSYAASKQVLISDFSIKKNQLLTTYQYPSAEWRNARKFAIYGKFKVSNWMNSEIPILSLNFDQPNINSFNNNQNKITVQDNSFVFYSYHKQFYDPNQYIGRLTFDNKDFGQWIFVYQGFDMDQSKMFTYIKSANKEMKILTQKSISHVDAQNANLVLGASNNLSDSDQIDLKDITISFGEGAYLESGFESLMQDQSTQNYDPCSHLFAECGFKGSRSLQCEVEAVSTNRYFKSIYIAPGLGGFTIAPPVISGQKPFILRFLKSIECVDHSKYFDYAAKGLLEIISLPDTYNKL